MYCIQETAKLANKFAVLGFLILFSCDLYLQHLVFDNLNGVEYFSAVVPRSFKSF